MQLKTFFILGAVFSSLVSTAPVVIASGSGLKELEYETNSGTYENNREAVEKRALAKLEGLDYETNSGTYKNNREGVEKRALAKSEGLDYETNSGTYENNRERVEK